jgi:ketosteroid isomerase-like protein
LSRSVTWLVKHAARLPAVFANHVQRALTRSEGEVRTLISQWVDAFEKRDYKRLAALETPDVAVVDRFGELHLPSGRHENEELWEDTFEVVAKPAGVGGA